MIFIGISDENGILFFSFAKGKKIYVVDLDDERFNEIINLLKHNKGIEAAKLLSDVHANQNQS
jgi:hypothetical protein